VELKSRYVRFASVEIIFTAAREVNHWKPKYSKAEKIRHLIKALIKKARDLNGMATVGKRRKKEGWSWKSCKWQGYQSSYAYAWWGPNTKMSAPRKITKINLTCRELSQVLSRIYAVRMLLLLGGVL
jgi:hypothetical protein